MFQNLLKIRPMAAIKYSLSQKAKHPPFNLHSILNLSNLNSHSRVHNLVTATFPSKINPCHIRLHIYLQSIPVFFYHHKMSYVTCPNMVFWPEIWMGTSNLIHVLQISAISAPWICTVIIRYCKYYDDLISVIFSSFPLFPQIYVQTFCPEHPKNVTPLLWRSGFI
jgi:hypothetical protein